MQKSPTLKMETISDKDKLIMAQASVIEELRDSITMLIDRNALLIERLGQQNEIIANKNELILNLLGAMDDGK